MVNQDFCRFLESIFRKDRTVGCDFKSQFIVVGLLINAEVFNCVFDVDNRGINRVDCDYVDLVVGALILFSSHPTSTHVDSQYNRESCAGIQNTDDKLGVHDFETTESFANVTGRELLSA